MLLVEVLIGDTTSLRTRLLFSFVPATPFIVSGWFTEERETPTDGNRSIPGLAGIFPPPSWAQPAGAGVLPCGLSSFQVTPIASAIDELRADIPSLRDSTVRDSLSGSLQGQERAGRIPESFGGSVVYSCIRGLVSLFRRRGYLLVDRLDGIDLGSIHHRLRWLGSMEDGQDPRAIGGWRLLRFSVGPLGASLPASDDAL